LLSDPDILFINYQKYRTLFKQNSFILSRLWMAFNVVARMFYQFDDFSLDTERQTLIIQGAVVAANVQIVKFLSLLIEAYPQSCKKHLLHQELWNDTVVTDSSIARLVTDTRKLFKLHGYNGPLIQTIHGQGYRLAAELNDQALSHTAAMSSPIPQILAHKTRLPWVLLVFIVAIFLTLTTFKSTMELAEKELKFGEPVDSIGRILWVDDNVDNNAQERRYLEQNKIGVYTTTNTVDALSLIELYHYDVIISDMGRQDSPMAGIKLLQQIRQVNNQTPFILYTLVSNENLEKSLTLYGGQGVATKTDQLMEILSSYFVMPDK
jgi:DNA-binding response OmpR family regulator